MAIDSHGLAFTWGASADFQTGHHVEKTDDNKHMVLVPTCLEELRS